MDDEDDGRTQPVYRYPREWLSEIMETAFPGISGFGAERWARLQGFATHEDDGLYGATHEVQFQIIGVDDHMGDDMGRWMERGQVQDAIDRILSGEIPVTDAHREQIRRAATEGTAIDPDVADLVIQTAEFGSIRYEVGWRPDVGPPSPDFGL